MSDLKIRREHQLGLARARAVAQKWAEHAQKKLEMKCEMVPGETQDVLRFSRTGVTGEMLVCADAFELNAKLAFLFKPFAGQIEAEARRQLDTALAKEAAKDAAKGPGSASA